MYCQEYCEIYSKIINRNDLNGKLKIISFGCGNCIDLFALKKVLENRDKVYKIKYTGIDPVTWNNRIGFDYDDYNYNEYNPTFIEKNMKEYINDNNSIDFNIYFFGKSIRDIGDELFKPFKDLLRKISENKIYIVLSTIKKKDGNKVSIIKDELVRIEKIKEIIKDSSFNIKYELKESDDIINYGKDPQIIKEIKLYVNELTEKCEPEFKERNGCYEDRCNRQPMLDTNYFSYIIICLEKVNDIECK